MKSSFVLLLALMLVLPCAALAETIDDNDLRIELEPLYLWRNSSSEYTMLYNTILPGSNVWPWRHFNTGQIQAPAGIGFQGDVTWQLSDFFAIQVGGFWTPEISTSGTQFDPNEPNGGGTDAVYNRSPGNDLNTWASQGLQSLEYTFDSQIWGLEANLRGNLGDDLPWLELYLGYRYISYYEELGTVAYDDLDDYQGTDNEIDRVNIVSSNHLHGAQLGVDVEFELCEGLTVGTDAWVAAFRNLVSVSRDFRTDDRPNNVRDDSMSGANWAYGFGFSPELRYQPWDNVAFTLGGDFIHISNISMAGAYYKTVANLDDDTLRPYDGVVYMGAHAGIVIMF
ncbi:MAG: hypothetical protein D6E12_13160 [Desulfovibrio sp.]|nr:MAG: hypothetical protein D6E12_13160 [Desulfovibrio sp.]